MNLQDIKDKFPNGPFVVVRTSTGVTMQYTDSNAAIRAMHPGDILCVPFLQKPVPDR